MCRAQFKVLFVGTTGQRFGLNKASRATSPQVHKQSGFRSIPCTWRSRIDQTDSWTTRTRMLMPWQEDKTTYESRHLAGAADKSKRTSYFCRSITASSKVYIPKSTACWSFSHQYHLSKSALALNTTTEKIPCLIRGFNIDRWTHPMHCLTCISIK